MTLRRFSTSNITTGAKSSKMWDGETFPGYFESIATVVVGSAGQSTVTFSNIPQNYAHLQLRLIARTSYVGENSTSLSIRFNGDSGSNYAWHRLYGNGSNALAGAGTSQSLVRIDRMPATSVNSSIFGAAVVDILDYTSTNKNKTVKSLGGWDASGEGWIALNSGVWINYNTAITSITIADADSTNLPANSHFALYGIRSA